MSSVTSHWRSTVFLSRKSLRTARHERIERWCNSFASELLMPREWICREADGSKLNKLYERLVELVKLYQVSREAMLIRLSEVTPVNVLRISKGAGAPRIRTNRSKEEPLYMGEFTRMVLRMIERGNPVNDFLAKPGVSCVVRAQGKSRDREDWIALLSKVEDGLTIKCSRRSELRA